MASSACGQRFRGVDAVMTEFNGEQIKGDIGHCEVLEPSTAEVLTRFTNVEGNVPSITLNRFGKGRAIYVTSAQPQIIAPTATHRSAPLLQFVERESNPD